VLAQIVVGTSVLAHARRPSPPSVDGPLSAAEAVRLIDRGSEALSRAGDERSRDLFRQLGNMRTSIETSGLTEVPEHAARILRGAVADAVAHAGGDATDLVGAYDIDKFAKKMAELKAVPVSVAQALLQGGQAVIAWANQHAVHVDMIPGAAVPVPTVLPGQTGRDEVVSNLDRHAVAITKLTFTPNTPYGDAHDLEKWVTQAFIEANAVDEGNAYIDQAWDQMWSDMESRLASLPKEAYDVAKAIYDKGKAAVETVAWYASVTFWIVAIAGLLVAGGLAYGLSRGHHGDVLRRR
jgi:hypothetical protein